MFQSPIAIGLSPNTQSDDFWQAAGIILQPWKWKRGEATDKIEDWFKKYFKRENILFFNSGRSALMAILNAFDIGIGNEVIIQAFTCVAVPDPIIWCGAKPVYVDIDESLNIDPDLLEKHITENTKAIIVQHTFGISAKLNEIKKIAQKHKLFVIEDCAHSLGALIDDEKVGTISDAAFFSFGRDKVISSVFGGMATVNPKLKKQTLKIREYHSNLIYPGYFWIFQQIFHPIAMGLILPLYNLFLGKIILLLLQKLKLLSKPLYMEEFNGGKPQVFPKRYPNALAFLLLAQIKKLGKYNEKRKEIADFYYKKLSSIGIIQLPPKKTGSIYMRFNILSNRAEDIIVAARKQKIILGNWYKNTIDPKGVNLKMINYRIDLCPNAEKAAKLSVNLPTYPRLNFTDLNKIANLIIGLCK